MADLTESNLKSAEAKHINKIRRHCQAQLSFTKHSNWDTLSRQDTPHTIYGCYSSHVMANRFTRHADTAAMSKKDASSEESFLPSAEVPLDVHAK